MTVRVSLGGKPVRRLRVRFAGRARKTDALGRARFVVRLRRAGLYRVRVSGAKTRLTVRAARR